MKHTQFTTHPKMNHKLRNPDTTLTAKPYQKVTRIEKIMPAKRDKID